ncbi:MAG: hypothetical protein AB1651_10560 [Pseudomonadota bacterium]
MALRGGAARRGAGHGLPTPDRPARSHCAPWCERSSFSESPGSLPGSKRNGLGRISALNAGIDDDAERSAVAADTAVGAANTPAPSAAVFRKSRRVASIRSSVS